MKKVLFSMVLLLSASISFAQVKVVKEAKALLGDQNPNFAVALSKINAALTNPETQNDPETWNVAGLIQLKQSSKEQEKAYLKKPFDTLLVYNNALNMCKYFLKCDELAQKPDAKGKIKNKYRKPNSQSIFSEMGNLVNGGIQYYNLAQGKEEYFKNALDFFGMYVDLSKAPMMQDIDAVKNDTLVPTIAYYASLSAMRANDYENVIKYAPYATSDPENGKYAAEFLATAYKAIGNQEKWLSAMQEGLEKYPEHTYFFANLIDYYINNDKMDEAMQFVDNMLAKNPNSAFYLYVKAYLYHNMKEYDKALEFYKKTLEIDSNYAEAYSNMGLIYCLQAQDFSSTMATDFNDPKYKEDVQKLTKFYQDAKPCYERARQLKPENKDLWLNGLYRVYYNLNMGDEFKEVEALMNNN